MKSCIAALIVLTACICLAVPAWADDAVPRVLGIRYSEAPEKVRVVLDLSRDVPFVDLSSPKQVQVKLDIPLPQALPDIPLRDPVVSLIRLAPDDAGKAQLTVNLKKARKSVVSHYPPLGEKPHRLVVDVLKRFRQVERRELTPGVTYLRIEEQTDACYTLTHLIEANTRDPKVRVSVVAALGERERVAEMQARTGAVAGVNGGYFREGTRPVGLLKAGGQVLALPLWGRTAVAFPAAGAPVLGNPTAVWRLTLPDGTTRGLPDWLDASVQTPTPATVVYSGNLFTQVPATPDGLIAVTRNGAVAARGTELTPLQPGDLALRLQGDDVKALDAALAVGAAVTLTPVLTPAWTDYPSAVGAGPRLLRNGNIEITVDAERIKPDIALGRPARTGLGLTADGVLVLAVVEGPGPYGGGATLQELAEMLKSRGVVDGMNLDGGGSTGLALNGTTVNALPGTWVRPVASGVMVFDERFVKAPEAKGPATP